MSLDINWVAVLVAALATFLIDREASRPETHVADQRSIDAIQDDIAALRAILERRLNAGRG